MSPTHDTDEKLKKIEESAESKLAEAQKANTEALVRVYDSINGLKDEVVEGKLATADLKGDVKLLDSKIKECVSAATGDIKDWTSVQIKNHEKEKHSKTSVSPPGRGASDSINISLPLKVFSGLFGASAGGGLIYWLLSFFTK